MSGPLVPRDPPRSRISGRLDAASPAEAARRLAEMAERLRPDWNRPERWHENKSELIAACRRLARTLEKEMIR